MTATKEPQPAFRPIWGIPDDCNLPIIFETYKPSQKTLHKFKNERVRRTYAELLTTPAKLGPLQDLCVRALAQKYPPKEMLLSILENPLQSRIYYDTLSVDFSLHDTIDISDEKYWRRVVLAKSTNKALVLKKIDNWKCMAVSLKLAEILENCPAEYLDEEEMALLADKIKSYVTELHLRSLRSLNEHSFEQSYITDSDPESDEVETSSEEELFGRSSKISVLSSSFMMKKEEEEWQVEENGRRAARIQEQRSLKEERLNRKKQRDMHKAEKKSRDLEIERAKLQRVVEQPPPKKKKKVRPVLQFGGRNPGDDAEELRALERALATPLEPVEPETIMDGRNKEAYYYERTRRNKYPVDQCHHIPMSFLRFFENLVSFTIEFKPAKLGRGYHSKYFNFSYMDILQLSYGLATLPNLRIFRLRNSRMSARKLFTLATSLERLKKIQVLDFGYDQLKDDCDKGIELIFNIPTLISLELEGNMISTRVMKAIAEGLRKFMGKIEYLGLARNAIEVKGMRALCKELNRNEQVSKLCLAAASISQKSIAACLSRELIRFSNVLEQLDLTGVRIGPKAGIELVSALRDNQMIVKCDVQGCGLEADVHRDIALLCKRNQYIAQNPYIEDVSATKEQIEEHLEGQRNPIFTRALEQFRRNVECYVQHNTGEYSREESKEIDYTPRPTFIPHSILKRSLGDSDTIFGFKSAFASVSFHSDSSAKKTGVVVAKALPGSTSATTIVEKKIFFSDSQSSFNGSDDETEPFQYDPNEFDERQFQKHVFIPGREDHFYYLKAKSRSIKPEAD